jgi:hypothetical protein
MRRWNIYHGVTHLPDLLRNCLRIQNTGGITGGQRCYQSTSPWLDLLSKSCLTCPRVLPGVVINCLQPGGSPCGSYVSKDFWLLESL